MIKKIIPAFFCLLFNICCFAQTGKDSSVHVGNKTITLSELVINNKLNVPVFINRIKNDSSFYKAFRNLRILGFTSINDIRMNNSDGTSKASLQSKTRQIRSKHCRSMITLEEEVFGDMYDENHEFNYHTAQMYASLFFTKDSICGEDNIVAGREFNTIGKKGIQKQKEQLKMLFFNPGKKINGLPFISNKTEIFEDAMAEYYDMEIDMVIYNNLNCFVFKQKVKPESRNKVVIDEMTTWFNDQTYEVMARNYSLSYSAAVYDFKVLMEVQMTKFGDLLVPSLIKYHGNWKAIFKPRERGVFTATLFDFK